jgi:hypothetical protein
MVNNMPHMNHIIRELQTIISDYKSKFENISEADLSAKPFSNKWSKKEVLGHLIDSAQNSLRRFICSQYESQPPFIVYEQDFWVASNRYQHMPKPDLIGRWRLMNVRICAVLAVMPSKK